MNTQRATLISLAKGALISALGVLVGSALLDGISYDSYATLALVVVALSVFSAILKPLLVLMALPFVVVTLGVGILFINALLYLLAAQLIGGFTVESFGNAFFGALIVSFFNILFSGWIGGGRRGYIRVSHQETSHAKAPPRRQVKAKDDIIDI